MTYKELQKEIKENDYKPVYLFTGEEEYLMTYYLEIIKSKLIGRDMEVLNYIEIDGKDKSFEDIYNACETLPFMSPKKIVYVKDIMEIFEKDKDTQEKLNDYLPQVKDHVVLILRDKYNKLRKNTKIYKTVDRLRGVIEFKRLNSNQLFNWIESRIQAGGKKINNKEINYLIKKSKYLEYNSKENLRDIDMELKKIINNSEKNLVSMEDIETNFIEILDNNIFNLLDNIINKNTEKSLNIFMDMYSMNEPLGRVFYMILRQYRLLLMYKIFKKRKYNDVEIRNKLGIRPFEYNKIKSQASKYSESDLKSKLNHILAQDKKQKTSSQDDKLVLEILIVELCK